MAAALPTARDPFYAKIKVGHGGFIAWIEVQSPTKEMIEALPALGRLERGALVVSGLYTHPKRRGRGWAARLVDAAQQLARGTGHDLYLWAQPFGKKEKSTRQLQNFYRKRGFVRVGADSAFDSWYFWAGFDSK